MSWLTYVSPTSLVNLSLGLGVTVAMPTGTIDVGHPLDAAIALTTNGNATLRFRAFGVNDSFGLRVLGNATPVAVPGAKYSEDGVSLQIYVAVSAAITGRCAATPAVTGCDGNLSWTASGSRPLHLLAPSSAGELVLTLANISLSIWANLSARGTVPILGNVTVPVGSPYDLADVAGSPSRASSSVNVTALPVVRSVVADPDPVAPGASYTISINATGGAGPLAYRYGVLPPGCVAANRSQLTCLAPSAGSYPVNATVTDADNVSASGGTELTVAAAGSSASSGSAVGATTLVAVGLAAGLGAAIGVVAASWALRRRRARSPPAAP